jgi:hypothetical protein
MSGPSVPDRSAPVLPGPNPGCNCAHPTDGCGPELTEMQSCSDILDDHKIWLLRPSLPLPASDVASVRYCLKNGRTGQGVCFFPHELSAPDCARHKRLRATMADLKQERIELRVQGPHLVELESTRLHFPIGAGYARSVLCRGTWGQLRDGAPGRRMGFYVDAAP